MKKTYFLASATVFGLVAMLSLGLAACSNDDDDNTDSTQTEAQAELDNQAFAVLRSLTDLVQYDANKQTDEDGVVTGIETLPSNWQNLTFACNQGVVLDSTKPTVRSVAVLDTDDAKDFFSDIIGEEMESDSCSWSVSGIGSLSFETVTGDDDLFAKIYIDIAVLPDVTEIDLVPSDVIEAANSENSYSGTPWYSAGDIIRNIKDNTLWICVRPAGGDLKKDKSYWICLNPAGKNIIKSETKTVSVTIEDTDEQEKKKWTYAKNLMSLKTAKAAAFTFNCLANPKTYEIFELCKDTYDELYTRNVNLQKISAAWAEGEVNDQIMSNYMSFAFAYGSPKNDSKRPKKADVKYVQPYLLSLAGKPKSTETKMVVNMNTMFSPSEKFTELLSLTDKFDTGYFNERGGMTLLLTNAYNFEDFLHTYDEENGVHFVNENDGVLSGLTLPYRVVISPELCLKDNKGSKDEAKKPSKSYADVFRAKGDDNGGLEDHYNEAFDYWEAVKQTKFFVDLKQVSDIDS